MKIKALFIVVCILGGVIIVNLFYKQIICSEYWLKLSKRNTIRIVPQPGARGRILDRNDNIIADSKVRFNLAVIPQEIKNKDELFTGLSELLNVSSQSLEKKFKNSYLNPFSPVIIASFIGKEKAIILEQQKEKLPGMIIQTDFYRFYPYEEATAHILGYVSKISKEKISKLKTYGYTPENIVGYSGIEEQEDSYLQSISGGASYEVDSLSRAVRLLGMKPSVAGGDLKLTIDIEMQKIIQGLMSEYKGAAIIMDYNTGEILSLASSPSFNSNIFITAENSLEIAQILNDKDKPLFNRAISAEYSPGSTFKVILALAGLELDIIGVNDRVVCDGSMRVGAQSFVCWTKHGLQNIREALQNSCNIFFYRLGLQLGLSHIAKYAAMFGLNKKTGIDIPNEKDGFIPGVSKNFLRTNRRWYSGDTTNVSIGQGDVLVTPIQMVCAVSVVANGGKLLKPHLIYDTQNSDYAEIKLTKSTVDIVREGLTRAVLDVQGTAHILLMEEFEISGKTGTAQVSAANSHGWFVGYIKEPSWAVCVFLENVGGSYESCKLLRKMLLEMDKKGIVDGYK